MQKWLRTYSQESITVTTQHKDISDCVDRDATVWLSKTPYKVTEESAAQSIVCGFSRKPYDGPNDEMLGCAEKIKNSQMIQTDLNNHLQLHETLQKGP